jgi:hypothetical protein
VRVTQPITEVASFAPASTGGQTVTTSASTSIWAQWTTWIGLAAVGLVVGLVVGLLVSRRSGRSPPKSPPSSGPETTEETVVVEPAPADQGGSQ